MAMHAAHFASMSADPTSTQDLEKVGDGGSSEASGPPPFVAIRRDMSSGPALRARLSDPIHLDRSVSGCQTSVSGCQTSSTLTG